MRRVRARALLISAAAAVLLAVPAASTAQPVKTPTAIGTGGAAASVEVLATDAAVEALRDGANAVDAAVVAAARARRDRAVLGGIGGGGFMLDYRTAEGEVTTIDRTARRRPQRCGPSRSSRTARRSPSRRPAGAGSRPACRAPSRPGTRRSAPLRDDVAEGGAASRRSRWRATGFVVDQTFVDQTAAERRLLRRHPVDRGALPRCGRHAEATWAPSSATRITPARTSGSPNSARRASTAAPSPTRSTEAVQDPPVAPDANHVWRPGVDDDARPEALRRARAASPRTSAYRGLDVFGMGPPSSGGSTVGEALNILEGFDLSASTRDGGAPLLPRGVALLVRRPERLSSATRTSWTCRSTACCRTAIAAERRALINPSQATNAAVPPGDPWPFDGGAAAPGQAAVTTAGEATTHLTVSDRWGNVVSYTFTIESTGGNGIVVPGWGFLLNNELTDFNFDSPWIRRTRTASRAASGRAAR